MYEVEFRDGSVDSIAANLIAENLYSRVDEECRSFGVLKAIVDHQREEHAVRAEDADTTKCTAANDSGVASFVEWMDMTTS